MWQDKTNNFRFLKLRNKTTDIKIPIIYLNSQYLQYLQFIDSIYVFFVVVVFCFTFFVVFVVFFVFFVFFAFFVFFVFFVCLSFLSCCIFVVVFFVFFVFLLSFLSFCLFCLFVTTIIIIGSISTTTPIFVPIRQIFNFTTHFTTNHYHYCHPPPPPPIMFSVPKRNTGKCFERPAKILRGRQRFGNNLGGGAAGGAGVLTIWF